ncbi:transposase [Pseudomonas siliginis]|uniref:Mutator family transposase n=1 Tax=Pseudomonas siliginis TaxID=2842346 RepID=A0ABY5CGQ0_9PSED|nr:transposase [Pseudomonas siliginis]UST86447.1 transposase [Pseudomonas siliginis]
MDIPRNRPSLFEPQLVAKYRTRWTVFYDRVISLCRRGMTCAEIPRHLEEVYGTEVSPILISVTTEAVSQEVKAWQSRPLEELNPIFYSDCIHVKVPTPGPGEQKSSISSLA